MNAEQPTGPGLARRQTLKAGVGGLCALCLARVGIGLAPAGAQPAGTGRGLVRPRPGSWFREEANGRVHCQLCPWACVLEPGQTARCRVRSNRGGRGYTLAYANPVLVQEDPVERLPFFHIRPGSRTLSISTAGCNLDCKFCEVWDMALVDPDAVHAYDMPPETVLEQARAAGLGSISYAFGEPVVFYEYMRDTMALARRQGLLNLLHTAAFIEPEPLRELCRHLDAANVDLKGFDPRFYRDVCGGELEPVLRSLELLRTAGVHLEITHLLIPTLNDDPATLRRMCIWIRDELGPDVPLHFARFYPLYRLANLPQTPVSTLDRAREIALEVGLRYVYIARVTGHAGENTYCPACGQLAIRRIGFVIGEIHLAEGRCSHCGEPIPGRWT
ncbi:AmmeMemoRadiSam system radical SAM enzyme [Thioalkalivibrio paradoxus]|uniref:Radical SAM protein n=1 Tax=Thioalkalivibrio paradoxus ARh 1 TaxID=713585 RepID=W0DPZ5_9GAMM|nr:AmmeMemoRadiSam system radical SAM enzyme [Thioalkalivibrio paradoxus]AHE98945.1 radical SAM protein [Thioalkalivibrio paradoxus ARh 1]